MNQRTLDHLQTIAAWHAKMAKDAASPDGLVDFHARERQAHQFIGELLALVAATKNERDYRHLCIGGILHAKGGEVRIDFADLQKVKIDDAFEIQDLPAVKQRVIRLVETKRIQVVRSLGSQEL